MSSGVSLSGPSEVTVEDGVMYFTHKREVIICLLIETNNVIKFVQNSVARYT